MLMPSADCNKPRVNFNSEVVYGLAFGRWTHCERMERSICCEGRSILG
ncbi:MAG: hypothetical protein ACTS5A_01485 [Candidatus Hodgkinia cicadicola]